MTYLIGIDIGTSGTKTVLFDIEGNMVSSALKEYPMYQPNIGWAEQNPEDWWDATYNLSFAPLKMLLFIFTLSLKLSIAKGFSHIPFSFFKQTY